MEEEEEQSDREKRSRGGGWGWAGDDTGEWGRGRRVMASRGGCACLDFEPQVEGERSEEEHLLPCDSPPLPPPLPPLPQ